MRIGYRTDDTGLQTLRPKPFADVVMHAIQAPGVRQTIFHRVREFLVAVPLRDARITYGKGRGRPGAAGVLSLRFHRQIHKRLGIPGAQLTDERLDVSPRHLFDRMLVLIHRVVRQGFVVC